VLSDALSGSEELIATTFSILKVLSNVMFNGVTLQTLDGGAERTRQVTNQATVGRGVADHET